jgi:2-C-methyl-D-erythritol 2,4-cyclodiphosphate synthase
MDTPRRHRVKIEGLAPKARKPDVPVVHTPTSPFLIGHGYDLHRLQPGGKLVLAGVIVSEEMSPIAHSDGDVILHALVDALLGATGQGDIGRFFPNDDPKWKDAPSRIFVEEACHRVQRLGYALGNVDITLLCERPKISPFREQMITSLRAMLGPDATINVKAGTNEGCDSIGKGEAIAAHAVVMLVRKG